MWSGLDSEFFAGAYWCDRVLTEVYWATQHGRRIRTEILEEVPEEFRGDVLADLAWESQADSRSGQYSQNIAEMLETAEGRWINNNNQ